MRQFHKIHGPKAMAYVIVATVVLLFMAFLGWYITAKHVDQRAGYSFNLASRNIAFLLRERLEAYSDVMYGTQGLFAASKSVEADEFERFVQRQHLSRRYPGVRALRYVEYVPAQPDASEDAWVIKYVEPVEGNEFMLGANMAVDSTRLAAMNLARDTGGIAATQRTVLAGDDSKLPAILLFAPIYRNGVSLDTVDARRQNLVGFVNGVFIVRDFIGGIFGHNVSTFDIAFSIHDADALSAEVSGQRLLYWNRPLTDSEESHGYRFFMDIDFAGRVWHLTFYGEKNFRLGTFEQLLPWLALGTGFLVAVLVVFAMLSFIFSRRKAIELAERITEDWKELAAIVDNADEAIVGQALDGTILSWNHGAEKLYGFKADEAKGKHISIIVPSEYYGDIPILIQYVKNGAILRDYETVRMRRGGKRSHVSLSMFPVRDREGKLTGVASFARDITDLKMAREELRRKEEYYRLLIENISDIITVVDYYGFVRYESPSLERVLGYKPEELVSRRVFDYVHPDDLPRVLEVFTRAMATIGVPAQVRVRYRHKDGSWRELESLGKSFKEKSEVFGIIVSRDITDQLKLESQLVQAQKMEMVGVLSDGIAHDINNQLTPVVGYIDLAMRHMDAQNEIYKLLVEARAASKRCMDMIDRLKNFSKPSQQTKEPLSFAEMMRDLTQLFSPLLPSTIQMSTVCPSDVWPVLGNENELHTVFLNLVANARDAMSGHGSVTLKVENMQIGTDKIKQGFPPGRYVVVSVKDTGAGIAPENIQRIFEPFFTTKHKKGGTGLGLAMVFNIVKSHGGWIEVDSEVGHGATFSVYFPAHPETKIPPHLKAPAKPVASEAVDLPAASRHETILVTDDEDSVLQVTKTMLEELGYRVLSAHDGEEACRLYESFHDQISAVILDVVMPKMSGRQALKKILALDPQAKIIIMSGHMTDTSPEELIREGAMDYLAKPFTIKPLADKLHGVLS